MQYLGSKAFVKNIPLKEGFEFLSLYKAQNNKHIFNPVENGCKSIKVLKTS